MTAEPRPEPPRAPEPIVTGLTAEAEFMSVAEFFESLRWEPPGADPVAHDAETFIASL